LKVLKHLGIFIDNKLILTISLIMFTVIVEKMVYSNQLFPMKQRGTSKTILTYIIPIFELLLFRMEIDCLNQLN